MLYTNIWNPKQITKIWRNNWWEMNLMICLGHGGTSTSAIASDFVELKRKKE